jgi:hypothetical protein
MDANSDSIPGMYLVKEIRIVVAQVFMAGYA